MEKLGASRELLDLGASSAVEKAPTVKARGNEKDDENTIVQKHATEFYDEFKILKNSLPRKTWQGPKKALKRRQCRRSNPSAMPLDACRR